MGKYLEKQERRLAVRQEGTWDSSQGQNRPGSMNPRKSASVRPRRQPRDRSRDAVGARG